MKVLKKRSPREIEEKFSEIRSKINNYVLSPDNFRIPPSSIYKQLDIEYRKVIEEYKSSGDKVNLFHVSHNYYWSSVFRYLNTNVTESMRLFIIAFRALLKRNEVSTYNKGVFEKMLGTYELAIIKISETDGIDYSNIEKEFVLLIEEQISKISDPSDRLIQILNILFDVVLKGIHENVERIPITFPKNEKLDELKKKFDKIINVLKKIKSEKSKQYSLSKSYESFYKLEKQQLQFLVKFIFFESDVDKKNTAQQLVDQIIKDMISFAEASLKHCRKYTKLLSEVDANKDYVKLMIALKELDVLSSNYYRKAYSEKNIFQAWKKIDEIRHFIVKKYFDENIKFSQELLNYFSEEWAMLDVFAKANLFRIEVEKRESIVAQNWEKEIFQNILTSLENIKKLFKYEVTKEGDYQLKIISAQFSGGFSEYFIHDLFEEYHECCEIDDQTPEDFKKLMGSIKESIKEHIKRNDFIEKDKPDIDIHIKKKCAVFLKNARLDSADFQQMKREFDLCKKIKLNNIYYAINFVKNLKEIGKIYSKFEELKKSYSDLYVTILDIKDMVEAFLIELERSGKSKLNFSRIELYKILDY